MSDQSMRGLLAALEASGRTASGANVPSIPVSRSPSVLSLRDRGPAQLFERVGTHSMPLVANLLNSRAAHRPLRLALRAMSCMISALPHCATRSSPVMVGQGPVQEVVHRSEIDLGDLLPVPTWFEREGGPYITAGVIIAKDPQSGRPQRLDRAASPRRRLPIDGRHRAQSSPLPPGGEGAGAWPASSRSRSPIGNHAAVLLASQMYVDLGDDELAIAGALMREPLRLVKCRRVDLEVPAEAEIVLEGVLRPEELIEEGPVSEFPGFYVSYGPGLAVDISCVTHRADAIYQAVLPGFAAEHCLLGAVAIEAVVSQALQRVIPAVRRVFVTDGGMGRLHAIITMHQPRRGEGKRAVLLAMGQVNLLKLVIVVEDDIDPEDWRHGRMVAGGSLSRARRPDRAAGRQGGPLRSAAGGRGGDQDRHGGHDPTRRWSSRQPLRARPAAARCAGARAQRARSVLI